MECKPITCATMILSQDKQHILMGKIAKQNKYDLPKGRLEEGETFIDAAIRELYEETNIKLDKSVYEEYQDVKNVKVIRYNNEKNMVLFFIYDKDNQYLSEENFANIKSNVYIDHHKIYPELSDFKLINLNKLLNDDSYARKLLNKSMFNYLRKKTIIEKIKSLTCTN